MIEHRRMQSVAGRVTPPEMADILGEVVGERRRQDDKWGDQNYRPAIEWLAILTEELGEVAMDTNEIHFRPDDPDSTDARAALRKELIQVAAVAVAWVEAIDDPSEE